MSQIVLEQLRQQLARAARIEAGLKQSGFSRVRRDIRGRSIAAFTVPAGALPHAEADQEHEEMPEGVHAGGVVVHPGISRTASRTTSARRDQELPVSGFAISIAPGSPAFNFAIQAGVYDRHSLHVSPGSNSTVFPPERRDRRFFRDLEDSIERCHTTSALLSRTPASHRTSPAESRTGCWLTSVPRPRRALSVRCFCGA